MLRHAEGLRQMYDKTRLTKNRTTKLPQKLRQNSCRYSIKHACSKYFNFSLVYNSVIR